MIIDCHTHLNYYDDETVDDLAGCLTRMQTAQEQYRSRHGHYAADLAQLAGASAPRSPEGLYQLAVVAPGVDDVTLVARARPDAAQHGDAECLEITMRLNQGLADGIANGRFAPDHPGLAEQLWLTTLAKLAVDQPGYDTYRRFTDAAPDKD